MPFLLALTILRLDRVVAIEALRIDQGPFILLVVPEIAVAVPLAILPGEKSRFDPSASFRLPLFHLQAERFDDNRPIGKIPSPLMREIDLGIGARQS